MATTDQNNHLIFISLEISNILESARRGKNNIPRAVASLKEKCLSGSPAVAASCTHALTSLVEVGVLEISQGLSTLISLMTATHRVAGLVPAVGRLLIFQSSQSGFEDPYNIGDRPHPFVTMLRHDWAFWDETFAFMQENAVRHWLVIRAAISGVFLAPKTQRAAKTQLIHLISKIDSSDDIFWELFSWQKMDVDWCWLLKEKIYCQATSDPSLEELATAASVWLSRQGYDSSIWSRNGRISTSNIFLLAKYLPESPTTYVDYLTKPGYREVLINASFSKPGLSCLTAALLQWALLPGNLTSRSAELCQELVNLLANFSYENAHDENNGEISKAIPSNSELMLAHDIRSLLEEFQNFSTNESHMIKLKSWLSNLRSRKSTFALKHLQFVLLGLLLQASEVEITKLLLEILESNINADKTLANSLLAVILQKLSVERNPTLQLAFLNFLPNLAIQKENIPLVLGTIESLQGGKNNIFVPVRLKLFLKLWRIQPRTFSYLHQQLISACKMAQHFDDIQLACASCLLEICQHSPDPHGRDVVNLLSEILNSTDERGAEAATVAIRAITCLCKNDIVDFQSSWQAIGPKMRHEKRPIVAAALCELLGGSSSDEVITREPIERLWKFVQDDCAAEAALRTLGKFSVETIPLTSLPSNFRVGLTVPKNVIGGEDLTPEQALTYVPGVCWIQLLEKSPAKHAAGADDLLRGLLKREIALFPRGLYALPLGGTEPLSLNHLPPNSILRAMVDCLRNGVHKGTPSSICLRILKLLSEDYNRPLPPLDWSFLRIWLADQSSREYLLTLCARQGPKSQSANILVEEYFDCLQHDGTLVDFLKEEDTVIKNLGNLCQCLSGGMVTSIITELLAHSDSEKLQRVLQAVRTTVSLGVVPEKNRVILGKALVEILSDLDLEFKDDPLEIVLWKTLSVLPDKILGNVTMPEKWATITEKRIKVASKVLRAKALPSLSTNEDSNSVLNFREIITPASLMEKSQEFVIKDMIHLLETVQSKNCRPLLLGLLDMLQFGNAPEQLFYLELLASATAVLSGYNIMCVDYAAKGILDKLHLFPQSIYYLLIEDRVEWAQNAIPHMVEGLYRLSKCETLPEAYRQAMKRGLLMLRSHEYCQDPSRWPRLFYIPLPHPRTYSQPTNPATPINS